MVQSNAVLNGPGLFRTGLSVTHPSPSLVTTSGVSLFPVINTVGDQLIQGDLQVTGNVYANSKLNVYNTFTPNLYSRITSTYYHSTLSQGDASYSAIWTGSKYLVTVSLNLTVSSWGASGNIFEIWVSGLPSLFPPSTNFFSPTIALHDSNGNPYTTRRCKPQNSVTLGSGIGAIGHSVYADLTISGTGVSTTTNYSVIDIAISYYS